MLCMHPAQGPKVVDLFAGAGGISEGFRLAGYQVVVASDIDPDACATFKLNFPWAKVVQGDVRHAAIKREILEASKGAEVVVGGPPCQAFSQVRNHVRIIDDPRNALYKEFVKIVAAIEPKAFLMENVTGIDQMGFREQIVADLELGGDYRVTPQVIDAADVGVPQTRKRLIFIGVRRSLGVLAPTVQQGGMTRSLALRRTGERSGRFVYDVAAEPDLFSAQLSKALADPKDMTAVTALQAISDLAFLRAGHRNDQIELAHLPPAESAYQRFMREESGGELCNVRVPRILADTAKRLAAIPAGGNYRDLPPALMRRNLTGQKWGQENGTGRLSRQHFYAYRRLHPDIWSWTLNTKADSVYHYRAIRALSVREFARLHSFPDRFVFATDARLGPLVGRHEGGAAHSRYRQVGNAVPPLLARACAMAIRRAVFDGLASEQRRRQLAAA